MTFNTALSGLRAANTDLEVTGNNIANASTTGFKRSRAEFGDVYANSLIGGGAASGSGVLVSSIAQQFDQGNVSFTDNSLDLAINGAGFFVLAEPSGATTYSRAGLFGLDDEGFVTNNSGSRLQAFLPTTLGGAVGGTPDDLQVVVSDLAPASTTEVDLLLNLDSRQTVPTVATFDPNDADSFTDSTSLTIFDSRGQSHVLSTYYVRNIDDNVWDLYAYIPDENGVLQNVINPSSTAITAAQVTSAGTADTDATAALAAMTTAQASVSASAAASPFNAALAVTATDDLQIALTAANTALTSATAAGSTTAIASATELVNAITAALAIGTGAANGADSDAANATEAAQILTATNSALAAATTSSTTAAALLADRQEGIANPRFQLNFNTDGTLASSTPATLTIDAWNPSGANQSSTAPPLTATPTASDFVLDLNTSTQFGSQFSVSAVAQDGFATGQLSGLEINATGEVFARYTNGEALILGQVAMASFPNEQGLSPQGDTTWAESFESGQPVVGAPLSGTLGAIQSGALEESNVDLSEELVRLIIAQRNFQANAKTIETADTVTQAIINIR